MKFFTPESPIRCNFHHPGPPRAASAILFTQNRRYSYLAIEDVNFRKLPRDGHGDEEGRFKMSVQIPPVDPDRTFTAEQRREIVLAHAETKHGLKGEFLRAAGVTPRQLYLWRRQLAAGTLDIGLTPRENIPMSDENIVEFSRLTQRNQELEALNAELGRSVRSGDRAREVGDCARAKWKHVTPNWRRGSLNWKRWLRIRMLPPLRMPRRWRRWEKLSPPCKNIPIVDAWWPETFPRAASRFR
ncbi:hypothetical protein CCANI_02295 [Corynebacterium canis]|nr:hypothetical protein CCANI_02295 [Corynebacterium canis]